jgi:hypothetical protein
MKKTTINAVEMVRRIRDAHYEQLRGKNTSVPSAHLRPRAYRQSF